LASTIPLYIIRFILSINPIRNIRDWLSLLVSKASRRLEIKKRKRIRDTREPYRILVSIILRLYI